MRFYTTWFLVFVLALIAGCGSPKVTGSTGPLTDEEKAKIAEETRAIEDEESPNNKTWKGKGGKR